MNIAGKLSLKQSTTILTPTTLIRLAGLSAVLAGLSFIVVGLFHPVNEPSVVTTTTWINVHIVAIAMGLFGMIGMAGLYARQVEKIGWLGLAGYGLFSLWLALVMSFSMVEAFILPGLATESPAFVAGFLGMFSGSASAVDLGAMPTLWNLSGAMFILGPLLFGIATFRARILPRGAAALQAVAALLVPVGGLVLPPEYQSLVMVPVGLALAWLGFALFAERQENTAESQVDQRMVVSKPGKVA
jgi:hypothetical protein